nr:MAG TPA: Protein of unknown function (DUF2752) [Caudoviricetes sp.]
MSSILTILLSVISASGILGIGTRAILARMKGGFFEQYSYNPFICDQCIWDTWNWDKSDFSPNERTGNATKGTGIWRTSLAP